jgi:probable addiction module antidote protein
MKRPNRQSFETYLYEELKDPTFAATYIMAALIEKDHSFLPVALGDVAKAYGVSKLADESGINRRTLYKVFDKDGNPSFDLVIRVLKSLNLELLVQPRTSKRKRVS